MGKKIGGLTSPSTTSPTQMPAVNEFASVAVIGLVSMLAVATFGAYWYKKAGKK